MIKVLTPTGNRPEAIANLNHYLTNQTDQDFQWVVLDDCNGPPPKRCDKFIKPSWTWSGENTQAKSLARLLDEVNETDLVLFCEDDDYYKSDYVAVMRNQLKNNNLVGIKNPIYYNIKNNTHKTFISNHHSSLCSTGITGDKIELFKDICCKNTTLLDSILWRSKGLLFNSNSCIGIKGMAGRGGIGIGHTMQGIPDINRDYLKQLIGEDEKRY
jgi:hypothetical protein